MRMQNYVVLVEMGYNYFSSMFNYVTDDTRIIRLSISMKYEQPAVFMHYIYVTIFTTNGLQLSTLGVLLQINYKEKNVGEALTLMCWKLRLCN